jgi:hypothetical protein
MAFGEGDFKTGSKPEVNVENATQKGKRQVRG